MKHSYKKILIINIFGIGDVLFTTPLISNIKEHLPEAFIGYVANKRTAPILFSNPKIDRVFVYERDDFNAAYRRSPLEFLSMWKKFLHEIRQERFDLVIDLSLNGWMSFGMWLAGIKNRMGFDYRGRSPFLTDRVPFKGYEERHVVEFYLDLLRRMDFPVLNQRMEIFPLKEEEQFVREKLGKIGIDHSKGFIALVPGGGASWGKAAVYKRWPAEKYAKLADKIVENCSMPIILMGDEKEKELCKQVAAAMQQRCVNVCGEFSLMQFAAALKQSKFAVVNDGGPLHVAVASGAKTISFFGPVDERVYGPYPPEGHTVVVKDIACHPCYRRFRMAKCDHISCLNALSVEEAWEKIRKVKFL